MKFGIIVNTNECVGCHACFTACKEENQVLPGVKWNRIDRIEHEKARVIEYFRLSCMHCEDPACMKVCPVKAIHKGPRGEVLVDQSKCIGCQFCAMACPYGVRYLNEEEGVVEKCTLCQQRTAQGELPQCVSQCCGMARWYGDAEAGIESFEGPRGEKLGDFVNDFTEDQVYQLTDVGNGPSMFYIMRNIKWQGVE